MAERYRLPDELEAGLLDEIKDKGDVYAEAKALADTLRERRKITKATLMKMLETMGVGSHQRQEREAYAHPQYIHLVEVELRAAIKAEISAEIDFKNAERRFDAWRTLSANERNAGR